MKKRFVFLLIALAVGCSPQVETWRMTELCFESATDYNIGGGDCVRMDVRFVHGLDTLVRPAFWDGAHVFRVRFAPTKALYCLRLKWYMSVLSGHIRIMTNYQRNKLSRYNHGEDRK